jgi:CPA1 family monovalent cation:H+ antiporter
MATGGYALADALGVSAPIATVVMGLMIGNRGRAFAMSEFNASSLQYAALAALSIPIALAARFVSVAIPIGCLSA